MVIILLFLLFSDFEFVSLSILVTLLLISILIALSWFSAVDLRGYYLLCISFLRDISICSILFSLGL
ncbi:hypothetical protein PORCRE_1443 [Porphyromonas crevioricanis JCM 15906]|uniref:Uncharacterized protein n=1 Tax=Porphyromonas crevioricanis JCM 15906 TaxID=1305617 RepID=T1CI50_9PORP|nr:hypothetical protein PORCRE_1443 [Porphyromonas crevioricanis JCM 15906]